MKIREFLQEDKEWDISYPGKIPAILGLPIMQLINSLKVKPEHKKFPITLLCLFSVISLLVLPVQAVPSENTEAVYADEYYSGIFITEKDPGTISVRWITEGNNDNFSIRYHYNSTESDEEPDLNRNKEETEKRILSSSISKKNISGLTLYSAGISVYPGCSVFGTLLKEDNPVQPFSFEIPEINSGFEFIVLSDLHSSPENNAGTEPETPVIKTITDCINSYDKPAFTVISGDLVHNGYRLLEWQEFFSRTSALFNKTVLYTTPGNHEKNSTYYYDIFGYPQFYSKENGECRFVFLDSNDNAAVSFPIQRELISNPTGNSGSDKNSHMNFVFFHHPPYSSDERHPGGWKNIRKAWGDSFENTENTVVFSGHVHAYERFETVNATYIVCGTCGGELYHLGVYPDENNLPKRSIEKKFGYMKVSVLPGGSSAEISFITPTLVDCRGNITKNRSEKFTDNPKGWTIPVVSDYSVAGDHYKNNRFLGNIMAIKKNYSFLQYPEDNRMLI